MAMDLVYKIINNFLPYVFLEECMYIEKQRKMIKHITEKIENSDANSEEQDTEQFVRTF